MTVDDANYLLEHLAEQVSFLQASMAGYDSGVRAEAKRLAVQVRVLAHDTKHSTSLLGAIGLKETMRWFEAMPADLADLIHALSDEDDSFRAVMPGLATAMLGQGNGHYAPTFSISPRFTSDLASTLNFSEWWTLPRMLPPRGGGVSRRDVVLWLANKDGGAHIDRLPPQYEAMSRGAMMGTLSNAPTQSPFPAAMRHIAEEVVMSLKHAGLT